MISANLRGKTNQPLPCTRCRNAVAFNDLHYNQRRTNDNTLDTAAKDGVCYYRKGLVRDHVGQEKRHQKQMSILPDRLDLVGVFPLLPKWRAYKSAIALRIDHCMGITHGVPLILNTFN